jgi:hypothetical protein
MNQQPLVPCTACQRHVRADESRCPFCGATGAKPAPLRAKLPAGRLSSLLVMTFHAAATTAVIGCGGETSTPDPSSGGAAGHAGSASRAGSVGTGDTTGSGGFDFNEGRGGTGTGGRTAETGGTNLFETGGNTTSQGGAVPIYRASPKG